MSSSCPNWQRHRPGCYQSPVRTLPLPPVAFVLVAPLWCDLGCCSQTVVVLKPRRTPEPAGGHLSPRRVLGAECSVSKPSGGRDNFSAMAGTTINIDLVTEYLNLFNSGNGMFQIESIFPDIQNETDSIPESQMQAFERFEEALGQLHWVLAAMMQCDNEISEIFRMDMKRKHREDEIVEPSAGSLFVHFFFPLLCSYQT